MKIPTGDNVRAGDIKQNGDAIVAVTLSGENPANITTPIGVLQAKAGSVVYFYDKGALKEITSVEQDVVTPIGTVKAKDGTPITFYESGVLSKLNPTALGYDAQKREIAQKIDLPPMKGVELSGSRDMTFYESGKLKRVYLNGLGQTLATPIGTFVIEKRKYSGEDPSYIEYYESGSPKIMYAKVDAPLTVKGVEYGSCGWRVGNYFHYYPRYFHDSGSSDVWLLESFVTGCYKKDGKDVVSATYENALGKFEIAFNPDGESKTIRFDKDGNVLSARLYKSPDATVKVNGQDVYIKGGRYTHINRDEWRRKSTEETFCGISFYDNGAVKSCVLDELVVTEIDGIKLTLPAGEEIELWENGNIKQCYSSNPALLKVGKAQYSIEADSLFLFHRNGKFRAVENNLGYVDTFYSDGAIKRVIRCKDGNDANIGWGYVLSFLSPKSYEVNVREDSVMNYGTYAKCNFQSGDIGRNVSMVFFDDKDNPSSYTMFKLDKDGNYILDDEGIPIEDPAKKRFKR